MASLADANGWRETPQDDGVPAASAALAGVDGGARVPVTGDAAGVAGPEPGKSVPTTLSAYRLVKLCPGLSPGDPGVEGSTSYRHCSLELCDGVPVDPSLPQSLGVSVFGSVPKNVVFPLC